MKQYQRIGLFGAKKPRIGSNPIRGSVLLTVCLSGLQSLCQLIGAGGLLHAAGDTFDTGDDFIDIHSFHQLCNALQIAVAAAQELDVLNLVVLQIEVDHLGAGTLGLVLVHNQKSFLSIE